LLRDKEHREATARLTSRQEIVNAARS
jgi:hypothetical protein